MIREVARAQEHLIQVTPPVLAVKEHDRHAHGRRGGTEEARELHQDGNAGGAIVRARDLAGLRWAGFGSWIGKRARVPMRAEQDAVSLGLPVGSDDVGLAEMTLARLVGELLDLRGGPKPSTSMRRTVACVLVPGTRNPASTCLRNYATLRSPSNSSWASGGRARRAPRSERAHPPEGPRRCGIPIGREAGRSAATVPPIPDGSARHSHGAMPPQATLSCHALPPSSSPSPPAPLASAASKTTDEDAVLAAAHGSARGIEYLGVAWCATLGNDARLGRRCDGRWSAGRPALPNPCNLEVECLAGHERRALGVGDAEAAE